MTVTADTDATYREGGDSGPAAYVANLAFALADRLPPEGAPYAIAVEMTASPSR